MHGRKRQKSKTAILITVFFSLFAYVGCGGSGSMQPKPEPNPNPSPRGAPPVSAVPFEKSIDLDLSSSSSISPQATFTLSNQGKDPVVMPAVVLQGNPALNRSSVLFPLQGLKDEDFAIATWKFVVNNSKHYCEAGSPADPAGTAMEPMRLLNGYGGMCCDQGSQVLVWLWQGAGYQARYVDLAFHGVPEIFYQGAWHMFDSDHHVYYLQTDNKTVASVADVIANPSLVARVADANGNDPSGYPAQMMADQYAASTPIYENNDLSAQNIFVLQPGQSVSFNYANIVPVFQGAFPEASIPPAATGSFDWSLDYSNPDWNTLPSTSSGVTTVSNGSQAFLTNTNGGQKSGFAIYAFSSPFPVISLRLSGLVDLTAAGAAVNAYFSTDGVSWPSAFPLASGVGGSMQTSVDLSSAASGQYSYFIKLEMVGNNPGTAQIANVHIVSDFQDSIFVFPNLVPGQVNHLIYQDWSPATVDHNVAVSLTGQ